MLYLQMALLAMSRRPCALTWLRTAVEAVFCAAIRIASSAGSVTSMRLHNLPATWNALMLLTGVQEVCSPEHEADRARVASTAQIYRTQLTRTRVCGDAHVELLNGVCESSGNHDCNHHSGIVRGCKCNAQDVIAVTQNPQNNSPEMDTQPITWPKTETRPLKWGRCKMACLLSRRCFSFG